MAGEEQHGMVFPADAEGRRSTTAANVSIYGDGFTADGERILYFTDTMGDYTGTFAWQSAAGGDRKAGIAYDHPLHVKFTTGTINMNAVNARGDISSVTTTSGRSWKIPGRVGDSPIVGAGQYCDNTVGAAGSTGRWITAVLAGRAPRWA